MYIIRKDELYLAGYEYRGIYTVDADGRRIEIPTVVYSADIRDVKVFDNEYMAEHMAKIIGGVALKVRGGK